MTFDSASLDSRTHQLTGYKVGWSGRTTPSYEWMRVLQLEKAEAAAAGLEQYPFRDDKVSDRRAKHRGVAQSEDSDAQAIDDMCTTSALPHSARMHQHQHLEIV
jgi:hypothetical protein